ncbi:hypothetical protein ACROYT_G027127 [Oculina patagonica]
MLLERIKSGVDEKLRKEQAGLRSKSSTTKQNMLRNILDHAKEWRTGLYVHFVDFEKAFDSVHRESLWNIMKSYGIPHKMYIPRTAFAHSSEIIVVNGEEVEDVEEFAYVGATVNKEGGGSKDITNRLQKARGAFQRLGKVWQPEE